MKTPLWSQAIKASADPQRAQRHLDRLAETPANPALAEASAEQARILAALFSGSQFLSNWLVSHVEDLELLRPQSLQTGRRGEGLRREIDEALAPLLQARDYAAALNHLRRFKQREMLRIGARDLARLADVTEITQELSDLADVCLNAVWQICSLQIISRFGQPYHQDAAGHWLPTGGCVLGLGKLGGQELNYSSDVDLIFVYAEEGQTARLVPGKSKKIADGISNHQFFNRTAERFIAEVGRISADGFLYRIDLRLRPEGESGPLARSLAGYENYYSQWGQTWERMMLIKTRRVAGDEALGAEFLEMIQPFRYPRSLGEGVLREVAAMKDRIENEVVKAGELDRNVKLGRGGIREVEFIAQTLQLLNAGRSPFLQGTQTVRALAKLVQYQLLSAVDAVALTAAYVFFRQVEHRLQMEDNLQTHTIPLDAAARQRLARLMNFKTRQAFENARKNHARAVRAVFDHLLRAEPVGTASALPAEFAGAQQEWKNLLREHGFKNAEQSFRLLSEFAEGPGYVHVSPRTAELARQLLPRFFALCPSAKPKSGRPADKVLSDPDRVLTRLDSFITAYGTRAMLFETWNNHPSLFELLLRLFDRSEFLAEIAIRTPDLVDELVSSGRLRQRKTAEEILADLRHGSTDADQHLWLRRYHQAEQMRIALRDILGLAAAEQNLAELSALADACLQYALAAALRKRKIKTAPLAIIGLGKLGGQELNYGSDLDLLFITWAKPNDLPKLQTLAVEIMDLLSARTEAGLAFVTDARLRPDGEKGLLVNTLDACEVYYRQRAQLWEIQALSRTRPVAGNRELGGAFQKLARTLANFSPENVKNNFRWAAGPDRLMGAGTAGLAAYRADWKSQIVQMRLRIEQERTPPGQDALAIKTGVGGLMDAEFIAQIICLEQGWQEASTLRALQTARDAGWFPRANADKLIENYQRLRRVENILRCWSFAGETVLPAEPEPFYRVAIRCGFKDAAEFKKALAQWRSAIRAVYKKAVCA